MYSDKHGVISVRDMTCVSVSSSFFRYLPLLPVPFSVYLYTAALQGICLNNERTGIDNFSLRFHWFPYRCACMANVQPRLVLGVRAFHTVRMIYPAYCRNFFRQKFDLMEQQGLKYQPALLEPPSSILVEARVKVNLYQCISTKACWEV
jgi:hypothetical protein